MGDVLPGAIRNFLMAYQGNTDFFLAAAGSGCPIHNPAAPMKILIIDPNPLFRRAARNFVSALPGCEAIAVASPHEALESAAMREAGLALIDYSLRGAVRRLRSAAALAPVAQVLLLTEDAADYRGSCLAAGADGCLVRDDLGHALPQLVAGLLRQTARQPA